MKTNRNRARRNFHGSAMKRSMRSIAAAMAWLGLSFALAEPVPGGGGNEGTETPPSAGPEAIPWAELGARAGEQYQGDGLAVTPTEDGALLRCSFQRLEGRVGEDGLWLESTAEGAAEPERFRVRARAVGREGGAMAGLPETGRVEVEEKLARYLRGGMAEEYSVSVDGVRQDFIIQERPAGEGALQVRLEVTGADIESAGEEVRLVLPASGRRLAYNRLQVVDATGRELEARFEVEAPDALLVRVEDDSAIYPLRVDPTFSDEQWLSMGGIPGTNNSISAAITDGAGNLYVGGDFTIAGSVLANCIAKWDGSQWSLLGSGMNNRVSALAVHDGELYAGGGFTIAGSVLANCIAKWDGSQWSALGSGMNSNVSVLAVHDGELYAGGGFTTAGGVAANRIAKWNGSQWSALGSGMNHYVRALAVHDGELYAGGEFTTAGGVAANRIAKWDGSQWTPLGSGTNGVVHTLAPFNGELYAGGEFSSAGGVAVSSIAKWDGNQWTPLGSGVGTWFYDFIIGSVWRNGKVTSLTVFDGELCVGGVFGTAGSVTANRIAKWDGSQWSALGSGMNNDVYALAVHDGELYAGGGFTTAGGVAANRIAKWDGNQWSARSSGMNSEVRALAVHDGELYAGGGFTTAGGVAANHIAKWDGNQWTPLGLGTNGVVHTLALFNGELYAGGEFSSAGGVAVNSIAKWDGNQWAPLESGVGTWWSDWFIPGSIWNPGTVTALTVFDGELCVGGVFQIAGSVTVNHIAKWDGSQWSPLGSGMSGGVSALAVHDGELYAGGDFTTAGGVAANRIAKWDGSRWLALGSGMSSAVSALAMLDGELYAGGGFTTAGGVAANRIAKWDGSQWSALGSGMNSEVRALAVLDGKLYAGGQFTTAGGVAANRIAKWDGSQWSALGSGMNSQVFALAVHGGELYAGGSFTTAGGKVSPYLAQAIIHWVDDPNLRLGVEILFVSTAVTHLGDTLEVSWRVTNQGQNELRGRWQDRLYLAGTIEPGAQAMRLGEESIEATLSPGASYTRTARVPLRGVLSGNWHLVVRAGEGLEQTVAVPVRASRPLSITWPALALGAETAGEWPESQWVFATLEIPAGTPLVELELDGAAGSGVTLHAAWMAYPDPALAATRGATVPNSSSQRLRLENPSPGTWYVAVRLLKSATPPGTYTLRAWVPGVVVDTKDFGTFESPGTGTLRAMGARLTEVERVYLRNASGQEVKTAESLRWNSGVLEVSFRFDGLAPGTYDAVFVTAGGAETVVAGGAKVIAAAPSPAAVVPQLAIPGSVRGGFPYPVRVHWQNTHGRDLPLPIYVIDSAIPLGMEPYTQDLGKRHLFLGFPAGGRPAHHLLAGQGGEAVFYVLPPNSPGADRISVSRFVERTDDVFDWDGIAGLIRPAELEAAEFEPILELLKLEAGPTSAGFARMLRESAALLPVTDSRWGLERLLRPAIDRLWAMLGGSISGSVRADGLSFEVVGKTARATLTEGENAGLSREALVLSDGSFVLPGLPAGSYVVTIDGTTLAGVAVTVTAESPAVTGELAVNPGATLAGRLIAASGSVRNVDLVLRQETDAEAAVYSVKSGNQGSFEFTAVKPGIYTLEVWSANHQAQSFPGIDLTAPGAAIFREVTMIPGGQRVIEITDADSGEALAGATVLASPKASDALPRFGQTEADGTTKIHGVSPGTWVVVVAKSGYADAEVEIDLAAATGKTTIALTKTAGFRGRVVDASTGEGIGGLALSLASATPTQWPLTAVTDANGEFFFGNVPPGRFSLEMESSLLPIWRQDVDLSAGMPEDFTVTLPVAARLSGTVNTPSGDEVPSASVFIMDATGAVLLRMESDLSGKFETVLLSTGNYTVQAMTKDAFSAPVPIAVAVANGAPLTTVIPMGALTITARLLDGEGEPVAERTVFLIDNDGELLTQTKSGSDGNLTFAGVAPGQYTVRSVTHTLSWSSQADTRTGSVNLGNLTGQALVPYTVQVNAGGSPVEGAIVQIRRDGQAINTAVTGADGLAVLRAAPGAGTVSARIISRNHQTHVIPSLNSGVPALVDLTDPVTLVTGHVRQDGTDAPIVRASVFAKDAMGDVVGHTVTDLDGSFVLRSLPREAVTLEVERKGYFPETSLSLDLAPNPLAGGLVFTLKPGVLPIEFPAVFSMRSSMKSVRSISEIGLSAAPSGWRFNGSVVLRSLIPAIHSLTGEVCDAKRSANNELRDAIREISRCWVELHNAQKTLSSLPTKTETDWAFIQEVMWGVAGTAQKGVGATVSLVNSIKSFIQGIGSDNLNSMLSSYAGMKVALTQLILEVDGDYKSISNKAGHLSTLLSLKSAFERAMDVLNYDSNILVKVKSANDDLILKGKAYVAAYERAARLREKLDAIQCEGDDDPLGDDEGDWEDVDRRVPIDPNDILGPWGYGEERWTVGKADPWSYTIRFENDPDEATATAAVVRIEQTIDPGLDLESFRFGDFGFGTFFFSMPADRTEFSRRFDFTETLGVMVDVEAGIDQGKRLVWWEFTSLDPETNMIPWDPTLGFLPVNENSPEGEGFVNYTIRPKAGLATGTRIEAQAAIVFDVNEPIVTPMVFNTIDADGPSGKVSPLPLAVVPDFLVQWGGGDGSGSGVASYTVYVSSDGGNTWDIWLDHTTLTSATYKGTKGKSYRFYVVARDRAGNTQMVDPATASVGTTVAGSPMIVVRDQAGKTLAPGTGKFNFGNVKEGLTVTRKFKILNTGPLTIKNISVRVAGAQAAEFKLAPPSVGSLSPGSSTSFSVSFAPGTKGARGTLLRVTSSDLLAPVYDVKLSGSGVSAPRIEVRVGKKTKLIDGKSILDFGSAKAGAEGAGKTVTITNRGSKALGKLSVTINGANKSDFVFKPLKVTSLAPGKSASFRIMFNPKAKGNRKAAIHIRSNDPGIPSFDITLKGKGLAAARKSAMAPTLKHPIPAGGLSGKPRSEVSTMRVNGLKYRCITIRKNAAGGPKPDAVEVSPDLLDWFSGPRHTTVVENGKEILRVRDNTPIKPGTKRFIRLRRD